VSVAECYVDMPADVLAVAFGGGLCFSCIGDELRDRRPSADFNIFSVIHPPPFEPPSEPHTRQPAASPPAPPPAPPAQALAFPGAFCGNRRWPTSTGAETPQECAKAVADASADASESFVPHAFAWSAELEYCYACSYDQVSARVPDEMHDVYSMRSFSGPDVQVEGRPSPIDPNAAGKFELAFAGMTCTENAKLLDNIATANECAAQTKGYDQFAFAPRLGICSACTMRGFKLRVALASYNIYQRTSSDAVPAVSVPGRLLPGTAVLLPSPAPKPISKPSPRPIPSPSSSPSPSPRPILAPVPVPSPSPSPSPARIPTPSPGVPSGFVIASGRGCGNEIQLRTAVTIASCQQAAAAAGLPYFAAPRTVGTGMLCYGCSVEQFSRKVPLPELDIYSTSAPLPFAPFFSGPPSPPPLRAPSPPPSLVVGDADGSGRVYRRRGCGSVVMQNVRSPNACAELVNRFQPKQYFVWGQPTGFCFACDDAQLAQRTVNPNYDIYTMDAYGGVILSALYPPPPSSLPPPPSPSPRRSASDPPIALAPVPVSFSENPKTSVFPNAPASSPFAARPSERAGKPLPFPARPVWPTQQAAALAEPTDENWMPNLKADGPLSQETIWLALSALLVPAMVLVKQQSYADSNRALDADWVGGIMAPSNAGDARAYRAALVRSVAIGLAVCAVWASLGYSLAFSPRELLNGFSGRPSLPFSLERGFEPSLFFLDEGHSWAFFALSLVRVLALALALGACGVVRLTWPSAPSLALALASWLLLGVCPPMHWLWSAHGGLRTHGAIDISGALLYVAAAAAIGVVARACVATLGPEEGGLELGLGLAGRGSLSTHSVAATVLYAIGITGLHGSSALSWGGDPLSAVASTVTAASIGALSWMAFTELRERRRQVLRRSLAARPGLRTSISFAMLGGVEVVDEATAGTRPGGFSEKVIGGLMGIASAAAGSGVQSLAAVAAQALAGAACAALVASSIKRLFEASGSAASRESGQPRNVLDAPAHVLLLSGLAAAPAALLLAALAPSPRASEASADGSAPASLWSVQLLAIMATGMWSALSMRLVMLITGGSNAEPRASEAVGGEAPRRQVYPAEAGGASKPSLPPPAPLPVTHRLRTIERADRELVLDQGAIVELGEPAQLLTPKRIEAP